VIRLPGERLNGHGRIVTPTDASSIFLPGNWKVRLNKEAVGPLEWSNNQPGERDVMKRGETETCPFGRSESVGLV